MMCQMQQVLRHSLCHSPLDEGRPLVAPVTSCLAPRAEILRLEVFSTLPISLSRYPLLSRLWLHFL